MIHHRTYGPSEPLFFVTETCRNGGEVTTWGYPNERTARTYTKKCNLAIPEPGFWRIKSLKEAGA